MDVKTRSRDELKGYFVKNSIPTEGNFADLIDGMINQKDDGLIKQSGAPLSLEAVGDDASTKNAINFYRKLVDENPDWTINLNPRSDAAKPETAKLGFNISDGDGNSRLFIDRASGNLGVGTIEAPAKLTVNGDLKALSNASGERSLAMEAPADGKHREDPENEDDFKTGLVYRAMQNPASGAPIFQIRSSGQAVRLFADHDGWTGSRHNSAWFGGTKDNHFAARLGIGTSEPKEKLEVFGNILANGHVKATGSVYTANRPLAYENYEIYLRGSAYESTEGNNTWLKIGNVSMDMRTNRSLNTVVLNPDGTYKNKANHDVYGNADRWNNWADWINANAADGDVVAVGTFDAINNPPSGGSAEAFLKTIGAGQAFQAARTGVRSPYALLFIKGRLGVIESAQPYKGPNAHIKTTYYDLQKSGGWTQEWGRQGAYKVGTVPGNAAWHRILTKLNGHHAYELIADIGQSGRHGLTHAIAVTTYGAFGGHSRGGITKTRGDYNNGRIDVRWTGSTYDFNLEIRTEVAYSSGVNITYRLIKLW